MIAFFTFLSTLPKNVQALLIFTGIATFTIVFFLGKTIGYLIAKSKIEKRLQSERSDAVKRSRAVIGGQVTEQFAPLFKDFPARFDEVKFLGKPVDFIAFKGLEENNEKGICKVDEVLFIEVKTGSSNLSAREKAIKKAVEEGKVRYVIWKKDFE